MSRSRVLKICPILWDTGALRVKNSVVLLLNQTAEQKDAKKAAKGFFVFYLNDENACYNISTLDLIFDLHFWKPQYISLVIAVLSNNELI